MKTKSVSQIVSKQMMDLTRFKEHLVVMQKQQYKHIVTQLGHLKSNNWIYWKSHEALVK